MVKVMQTHLNVDEAVPVHKRKPRVVVVGAGFAGLKVVKGLSRSDCEILLFDRHNYHLFQPLLYQVATAGLSPGDIAYPIRRIFRNQQNVQVVLGEVTKVELDAKHIHTSDGERLHYDYLVIAVGATHSYFGKPEWSDRAPGLKTVDDATEIRRRVLLAFEAAEQEADANSRRAKLTFVVIGGGPTGVEMAGALREIAASEIPKDFRYIDTTMSRIILLQGGDRLLPAFHPKLSESAKEDLEEMGVEVRLNARVTKIDDDAVWMGEERLAAANVIWAAGVQGQPIAKTLGAELDKSGRVVVEGDLSVKQHPEVFVVGDAAAAIDSDTKKPVPGLAPAAMQMGNFVARLIRDELAFGKIGQRPAFNYIDKGTMATIGKARAVADIQGLRFGGFIAWLMWGLIHISFLIGHRSKILVMFQWISGYVLGSKTVRLITGKTELKVQSPRLETQERANAAFDFLVEPQQTASDEVKNAVQSV
jgi:NADH:ubiquinone reductase (H+-translocating)